MTVNPIKSIPLFALSVLLNGCMTYRLSDLDSRTVREQDTISGIAYTKADSTSLPAGQYVFVGEKYIYVSPVIHGVLQAQSKLSNPILADGLEPLTKLWLNGSINRSSHSKPDNEYELAAVYCFLYEKNTALSPKQQADEEKALLPLFDEQIKHEGKTIYRFCAGNPSEKAVRLYGKPKNTAGETQLAHPIKVSIHTEIRNSRSARSLRAVLMPFAVATDIVTLPAQAAVLRQMMRH